MKEQVIPINKIKIMKHLKLFEAFKHGIDLVLRFKDYSEYEKAINFFDNESSFSPGEYNSEFLSMTFACTDQVDADVTEEEIKNELDENGFSDFYFESEGEDEEYFGESSDDLKANFRSWEYDHDNAEDANGLFNILVQRHPNEDKGKLKDLAFSWVGFEENEE